MNDIDWLTWWFAYIYARAKEVANSPDAVWQMHARDYADGLIGYFDGDTDAAKAEFLAMKAVTCMEMDNTSVNDYIEQYITGYS